MNLTLQIIFYLLFSLVAVAKPYEICKRIFVMDGKVKLNANEKVLVCGSDESENWQEIPMQQSIFHLKNIILNLGYLEPRMVTLPDRTEIWLGHKNGITQLHTSSGKELLDTRKKRNVIGEPLVTKKLDEIESWANLKIRSNGYACSKVKLEAQAWNGVVTIHPHLGPYTHFANIEVKELEGLDPSILRRYQPFDMGDPYDIRKTQIMTSRILADGLIQSAYFVTECKDHQAQLELKTSVGKPRIFRVGIGGSTEELPFLDVSLKNSRLDKKASSFIANLHASPRIMKLSLDSELYIFPNSQQNFLGPRLSVGRESEKSYAVNNSKLGLDIGRKWDEYDLRFMGKIGPTYNYTNTTRGIGPTDSTYPSLDGYLSVMSHDYEFSMADQYEGWLAQIQYHGRSATLESNTDLSKYTFSFKHLWSLGSYAPPLLVLGTRLEAVTLDTSASNEGAEAEEITSSDKVYLGGDDNLRGFARKSINNNGLGFLTALYVGFELRLIEELPYKLQPFLLYDFARVGNEGFSVEKPLFTSSGFGLRWASPFGTLRGSAAKGDIANSDASTIYEKEWVYFVSFGQEF